jgi:hypothetical protein
MQWTARVMYSALMPCIHGCAAALIALVPRPVHFVKAPKSFWWCFGTSFHEHGQWLGLEGGFLQDEWGW